MSKTRRRHFAWRIAIGFFIANALLFSQEGKPNFSGKWKFNKEKSELKPPTFHQMDPVGFGGGPGMSGGMGGPGMGGPGMGAPGMGGPGMGGPGMGGPGMGGPGMGGPAMGGPGMGGAPGGMPGTGGGDPSMMGIAESLVILHEEPKLLVKVPMKIEGKEQVFEFRSTTDGKQSQNPVPGGATVKTKTRWEKNRLVTKSTAEGPMGAVEVIEARTLISEGNIMMVEHTMKAGPMDWKRLLVYEKEPSVESAKP